jgi:hypothetical protein
VNGNDKAKKTFLNKKEAKVAKFQTPNEITLASHVEALVSHGGDNVSCEKERFCLCYLCFLLFKNLFALLTSV